MDLTIGLDATAVFQGAGIGRYARQLLDALARRHDPFCYRLFAFRPGSGGGRLPVLDRRFHVRSLPIPDRIMNVVWQRARLPLPVQVLTGPIDVFHAPDFALPPTRGTPAILTVYDLAFLRVPECAYPTLQSYLERVVPRSVAAATRIVAISQNTKRDVVDLLQVPEGRVDVAYPGVSPRFRRVEAGAAGEAVRAAGIDGPFILGVGTLEPRKNYVRLLEAYARLRRNGFTQQLVIAGGYGWMYRPIFVRLQELELDRFVRFIRPSDDLLVALYSACDAFVYPSVYEGFGIPVLEALACGAAVACSNASSLPEVAGDAGLTFDPYSVEAIADSLEVLLTDRDLRRRLRGKALAQAQQFSWNASAAQMAEIYRRVGGRA